MSILAGGVAADLIHRAGVELILAQPGDPDPSNGKGPEWGKAAPIGLLIIALLCIALFFLVKSMNNQFKKVPASFGPTGTESANDAAVPQAGVPAPAVSAAASDGSVPGDPPAAGGRPPADRRERSATTDRHQDGPAG